MEGAAPHLDLVGSNLGPGPEGPLQQGPSSQVGRDGPRESVSCV